MYHFMVNCGWSKVSFICLFIIRLKAALYGEDLHKVLTWMAAPGDNSGWTRNYCPATFCAQLKSLFLQNRPRNHKHTKLRLQYGKYCSKVRQAEALNQHIRLQIDHIHETHYVNNLLRGNKFMCHEEARVCEHMRWRSHLSPATH